MMLLGYSQDRFMIEAGYYNDAVRIQSWEIKDTIMCIGLGFYTLRYSQTSPLLLGFTQNNSVIHIGDTH